jgi:hypothetical protein
MKEMTASEELAARREVGQLMSNIMYNLYQYVLGEPARTQLDELRKRWDAIPHSKDPYEGIRANASKEALKHLMREISEDSYCAGWLSGLESELWKRAFLGLELVPFGGRAIEYSKLETLRILARATNSWWIWDDKLVDERCITFDEACKLFGEPEVMVCNCPPPNEYTLPSYNCPVHKT